MARKFMLVTSLLCLASSAFADVEPSIDEVEKLNQALAAAGCTGGEMEKNSGDVITYEVDDALCEKGQFDFKFDKEFKVLKKIKD